MPSKIFKVSDKINIPKYKQIINSLYESIDKQVLVKGDKIPSINSVCKEFSLSRDTVLVAFNELKAKGIIYSVPGKGYHIASTSVEIDQKIFLLFEEFNPFKEILYKSFIENLKNKVSVDIYFHHFNSKVFQNLIDNSIGDYTKYIVMPAKFKHSIDILKVLPQDKIIILDQTNTQLSGLYPAVYQDFENDMFEALNSGKDLLAKYKNIILVFPGGKEPIGQINGFNKFENENSNTWNFNIISKLDTNNININTVYIVPADHDLVKLVKHAKANKLNIGTDIGIISYNDTPLKEVVADGITTISTDFYLMGKNLAKLVLMPEKLQIKNPAKLIRRNSL